MTITQNGTPITTIWVHCAATRPEWMAGQSAVAKMAEIERWHRDRGWNGPGYHYLIDRDGTVAPGRPLRTQGAHVAGHNRGSVGICLAGGFGSNERDSFADHFTAEQDRALRRMIADLRKQLGTVERIRGHNEVAAKACPGFQVADWLRAPHREIGAAVALGAPDNRPSGLAGIVAAILRIFGRHQ